MKSYVMPSTSQHIPQTGTKICLLPSVPEQAGLSGCGGSQVLSERVPRDSQTSAVSDSVRSDSDFACSVPARNTCFAPVAARHGMTACLCVSLFIGRGVLDEHAYAGDEHADS